MRAIVIALAAVLGVFLSARPAAADPPVKAKLLQGDLVTAYAPCETPDATTDVGYPACAAVRSDPVCGFGPAGKGKFKVIAKAGRVLARGLLRGLEPACAGEQLYLRGLLRFTGEECQGSACTVVDLPNSVIGSCTVDANLRCKLVPPVPILDATPPPLGEYAVLDLHVARGTGAAGPRTFDAGVLLR